MSTKKPELRDYGITLEEYALYYGSSDLSSRVGRGVSLAVVSIAFAVGIFTQGIGFALSLAFFGFLASGLVALTVVPRIVRFKRSRLLRSAVASRIERYLEAETAYEEAERARQRKLEEYWTRLGGVEFERELATLYRHQGYRVESTPVSGDQGFDLILSKGGKTTVVQCKSHGSPVGPAVARELIGSMVTFPGADKAMLACTGGFTQGAYDFVRGKPIELVSASDLALMAERVKHRTPDRTDDRQLPRQQLGQRQLTTRQRAKRTANPICPMPGCRKKMVLRTGRHDRFWGCPGYPTCRGTRVV